MSHIDTVASHGLLEATSKVCLPIYSSVYIFSHGTARISILPSILINTSLPYHHLPSFSRPLDRGCASTVFFSPSRSRSSLLPPKLLQDEVLRRSSSCHRSIRKHSLCPLRHRRRRRFRRGRDWWRRCHSRLPRKKAPPPVQSIDTQASQLTTTRPPPMN